MFKILAMLLVEMVIIHIESKYAEEYDDLSHGVKIKEVDNEQRSG